MRKHTPWIIVVGIWIVVVGFFIFVMRDVLNPYGPKDYAEISHGDHVHYVPKDRDLSVSISNFPTTEPRPDQRILPDGRVVPRN